MSYVTFCNINVIFLQIFSGSHEKIKGFSLSGVSCTGKHFRGNPAVRQTTRNSLGENPLNPLFPGHNLNEPAGKWSFLREPGTFWEHRDNLCITGSGPAGTGGRAHLAACSAICIIVIEVHALAAAAGKRG